MRKEAYRLFGVGWSLAVSAYCADGRLCAALGALRRSSAPSVLSVVSLC